MVKTYRLSAGRKLINWLVQGMLRLGVGPRTTYLLTVKGRRSGKLYSTPVTLVTQGDQRWLVAPYGTVNWARNARAAGEVTLTRGRRSERVTIVELGPGESAPVLKEYVRHVPTVRSFFDATPDSPIEALPAQPPRHP